MNPAGPETAVNDATWRLGLLEAASAERALCLVDEGGRVVECSAGLAAMAGRDRDELLGGAVSALLEGADALLAAGRRQARHEGRAHLQRADGHVVPVQVVVHTPAGARGHALVVSELVTTRDEHRRLEIMGRLAGSVAHDFNNLLSVVLSYADLIHASAGPGEQLREDIDEIRRAAGRAAELTSHLLLLGRQELVEPRVLDLDEVVKRLLGLLRRVIGEDVALELRAGSSPACVFVDRGHLEQVLLGLVVLARDAMPTGGRLTLDTSSGTVWVSLALSHSGGGRPEPGALAALVERWGGALEASTGRVQLRLPRVEPAPARRSRRITGGHETVLLVEDEEQVLAAARTILRLDGYQVIDAHDPGEALQLIERHPGGIDLLLTDVVMPTMSGAELARRVTERRPGTKVIFMSGYSDDSVMRHGVAECGAALLHKPLTPEVLRQMVRDVLGPPEVGHG